MARRPAPKEDTDPLFGLPKRARGRHERAMELTLKQWRDAGAVIDPSISISLRSQAAAVDLAVDKGDYWHIGNANRVLMELRAGYINDLTAGPDPFDAFLREMSNDNDDHAEPGGTPIRDAGPP